MRITLGVYEGIWGRKDYFFCSDLWENRMQGESYCQSSCHCFLAIILTLPKYKITVKEDTWHYFSQVWIVIETNLTGVFSYVR